MLAGINANSPGSQYQSPDAIDTFWDNEIDTTMMLTKARRLFLI